ncbi:MAG: VWA domain-containing protein [Akkermansiaceae bacterium]|nr:VWA domain-containing protein [Akkermansiaceae bacterium]
MRRPSRQLNIFSISSLDLFASAMGAFVIITVILFPYYLKKAPTIDENQRLEEKLAQAQQKIAELDAAKGKIAALEEAIKKAETKADALQPKDIEVVFVCDTTGSMQDHIDGIKANLKDVVDILKLVNKRTRIGFVAYKDIVERGHANTYVTKTFPLREMNDTSFHQLNTFVDSLTAFVVNNRDLPESLSYGISDAINMPWSPGKSKPIIIVITDASAKDPGKTIALAKQFMRRSDSAKITTILARTENMDPKAPTFLKQLAQIGKGEYIIDSGRMLNSLMRATLSD